MDTADSDSDDFFSDIRALRRQFGISKAKTLASKETPKESKEAKLTASEINSFDQEEAGQRRKRANTPTPLSTETSNKRRNSGTVSDSSISQRAANSPTNSVPLGSVSPGEIAALLSPRKQRQKVGTRLASGRRSSGIPPRTPESRIASPQAPLFSRNSTFTPTPTKKLLAATPKRTSKGSASTSVSPVSPSSGFNMRSLWSRESVPNPTHTPTGQRLRLSPVYMTKQPSSGGFKTLAFRLDSNNSASNNEAGHFGLLGSVEEALVTDADLEASRRKLGEEYALTQQQIIREVRDRIMAFSCLADATLGVTEWRNSVSMLGQFYTLGHGNLAFTKQGIVWCGYMLGPMASVSQSFGSNKHSNNIFDASKETADTTLLFPWNRITALRRKDIDDGCFVITTVDHDLGVAFKMGEQLHDHSSSNVDTMVAKMNALLSDVLRNESAYRVPEPNSEPVNSECMDKEDVDNHKVRKILHFALNLAKLQDKRFVDLDVSRALNNNGFMADATSTALEFSLALATKASALIDLVDDPKTESLPGVCTLCYADNESVVFQQCDHRVCDSCFSHLRVMYPSSSQQTSGESSSNAVCICPWDRTGVGSWSRL